MLAMNWTKVFANCSSDTKRCCARFQLFLLGPRLLLQLLLRQKIVALTRRSGC